MPSSSPYNHPSALREEAAKAQGGVPTSKPKACTLSRTAQKPEPPTCRPTVRVTMGRNQAGAMKIMTIIII